MVLSLDIWFPCSNLSNKGRSPYNGKLSDFSFYIDSQIPVHRKFKIHNLETQKKYISMKIPNSLIIYSMQNRNKLEIKF